MKDMNIQENDLAKKKVCETIKTHIAHAPHTPSLCGILSDLLMRAAEKDRAELLQIIISDFHYVESDNLYDIPERYEVCIDNRLKKMFEENLTLIMRGLIRKSFGMKTEHEFYTELYNIIFERGTFETTEQKAFGLYLCCKNRMLPYFYIELPKKNCIMYDKEKIENRNDKRVDFLINYPTFDFRQKASLLMVEMKRSKRKDRDLLFERIISNYEEELNKLRFFYVDKVII